MLSNFETAKIRAAHRQKMTNDVVLKEDYFLWEESFRLARHYKAQADILRETLHMLLTDKEFPVSGEASVLIVQALDHTEPDKWRGV